MSLHVHATTLGSNPQIGGGPGEQAFPICEALREISEVYLVGMLYLRKEEGSYVYSLRVRGRELTPTCRHHKLIGISCLPFLRSRCRNPPSPKPPDLQMSSFMIRFALCFTTDKDHGCGTFVKLQGQTWPPHHRPLILGMPRPWDFTIHLKHKLN